jgi:hypothetical protein
LTEAVAATCGPMRRIAIPNRFEYEYETKHLLSIGPKYSIERFCLALDLSPRTRSMLRI